MKSKMSDLRALWLGNLAWILGFCGSIRIID